MIDVCSLSGGANSQMAYGLWCANIGDTRALPGWLADPLGQRQTVMLCAAWPTAWFRKIGVPMPDEY
eukprot:5989065-Prymnesium_polylepis.2